MFSEAMDKLTQKHLSRASMVAEKKHPLLAVMGEPSPFLHSVESVAAAAGIRISSSYSAGTPVIADRETTGRLPALGEEDDIDCLMHRGVSCVAQAIFEVLSAGDICGNNIVIVGRGHSVKGLAAHLINANATVTVVHSWTPKEKLEKVLEIADIAIIAAPTVSVQPDMVPVVLDISGAASKSKHAVEMRGNEYVSGFGKLATAILAERAALAAPYSKLE